LFLLPREAEERGGVEGEAVQREEKRRISPGFSKSDNLREARVGYLEIFTKNYSIASGELSTRISN
jgi:hypothetical protein